MRGLLAAALILISASAFAETPPPFCKTRPDAVEFLAKNHDETPVGSGFATAGPARNLVLEIFVSQKGTFSIVAVDRRGCAVIYMAGRNWLPAHEPFEELYRTPNP